jgi:hypothetical protein
MHFAPDTGHLFDSTSGHVYNSRHVRRVNYHHLTTHPWDWEL